MTLEEFKKKAKKMPDSPGVYFFVDKRKKVLYIGKAASIRERVRSYFAPDIAEVRSPLIAQMVAKAAGISWRRADSILEALILEASLIKTYKPKYNTDAKDDKSWNYVVITKEEFPRVLVVRQKELEQRNRGPRGTSFATLKVFGPFPHGLQLREALKIIRKIFPYRDSKCIPAQEQQKKRKTPRPCFNRHIGLCPGVCTGEISQKEYQATIRHISLLFAGKKSVLMKSLERDMRRAAREERFEDAQRLAREQFALKHIQDVSLIKEESRSPYRTSLRIESYDVAHLGGAAAVGVMTVVEEGLAKKSEYRKFRIRSAKAGDDVGALREILSRRLGHSEWPLPRLIVVDGATAQMNAAKKLLVEVGVYIPVVGVVKDERHRPREIRGVEELRRAHKRGIAVSEQDILLANAEAHRFAVTYHRKSSRTRLIS